MAQLPTAEVRRPWVPLRRALRRWRVPPSWARTLVTWAWSGAFAGTIGNVLSWLARAGELDEVHMLGSLGILAAGLFGALVLVLPFLACGGLYFLVFSRHTPTAGVLWCVGFHALAHLALVTWFLGGAWHSNLEVPILIGACWGLWLPHTLNPLGELDR